MALPNQKIPRSKKNEKWRIDCVNAVIMSASHLTNNQRKEKYYGLSREQYLRDLRNGEIPIEKKRVLCNSVEVDFTKEELFRNYNVAGSMITNVVNKQLERPFKFSIRHENQSDLNKYTKEEEVEFLNSLKEVVNIEYQKEIERRKLMESAATSNQSMNESDKMAAEINKKLDALFNEKIDKVYDIKKLQSKTSSKLKAKKNLITKIVNKALSKMNLTAIKNRCFEDSVVLGTEVVLIEQKNAYEFPTIKELDVASCGYHLSPNVQYIQDGDYAYYVDKLTRGQVMDLLVNKLTDEDLNNLFTLSHTGHNLPYNPIEVSANESYYLTDRYLATITKVGETTMYPYSNRGLAKARFGKGLFANNFNISDYYYLYNVYWRSICTLGILEYKNTAGQDDIMIVSEDYVIPEHAKKRRYRKNVFDKVNYKYVWKDKTGNIMKLEWLYLPEIWKGKKLNDIYFDIEPVNESYLSNLNPYAVKLPIHGVVYNNRGSEPTSPFEKTLPWQELYWSYMFKLNDLIRKDKGVWLAIQSLAFSSAEGVETGMALANKSGILALDTFGNSNAGMIPNTFKAIEKIDASNIEQIERYFKLLEYLDSMIMRSIGLTPAFLGRTSPNTNASDNARDASFSETILEGLFFNHDNFWGEVLNTYVNMVVYNLQYNDILKRTVRSLFDNEELLILEKEQLSFEDTVELSLDANMKNYKSLQFLKNNIQAMIQNIPSKTAIVDLLDTEDLGKFRDTIAEAEQALKEMQAQNQEFQERLETVKLQHEKDLEENRQSAELDLAYLRGLFELRKADIIGKYNVNSFAMESDVNDNKVPDVLEFNLKSGDLVKRAMQRDKELDLKGIELELKSKEIETKAEMDKIKQERESILKEKDLQIKEKSLNKDKDKKN